MTTALTFQETKFEVVERSGQPWLTSTDLAKALGFKRTQAVTQLFNRNKDEFTSDMSLTLKMSVNGFGNSKAQKPLRIFSLRGAHLLAMFAKTSIAKEFRKWVLDILDKEVKAERPAKADRTTTLERTPLKDAVNMLVAKRGLPYADAYKFIHHRFGVEHLDELTKQQLPEAIEYVHRLCMEGELIKAEPTAKVEGLTVTLPRQNYARYLVTVEDGKTVVQDASGKSLIDFQVAMQLSLEARAVAAYIESKAEQRDLEAKLLREESRRLRIFMGEENKSRLDTPISEIFMA